MPVIHNHYSNHYKKMHFVDLKLIGFLYVKPSCSKAGSVSCLQNLGGFLSASGMISVSPSSKSILKMFMYWSNVANEYIYSLNFLSQYHGLFYVRMW